jgi:sRNA-binding carbon storage regulator CsrA
MLLIARESQQTIVCDCKCGEQVIVKVIEARSRRVLIGLQASDAVSFLRGELVPTPAKPQEPKHDRC